MIYSIVVPVYRNAESIGELIGALAEVQRSVHTQFGIDMEAVFVVDGSPDNSLSILEKLLPSAPFSSQILAHARNFGSFSAIRTGLAAATGEYLGMIAADLQEPPELLVAFLERLVDNSSDIVVGVRESREDPMLTQMSSGLFWKIYRSLVIREIPEGGVDLFACTRQVKDQLLALGESHTSLIGLVYWIGFRRSEVSYTRKARKYGRSAWTLRKKLDYLLDSVFAFTDLPIRILTILGLAGTLLASVWGFLVLIARVFGNIPVSGYAATVLTIVFFGGLNTLGIGLVGHYAWRTYENTKQRPIGIVRYARRYTPAENLIADKR